MSASDAATLLVQLEGRDLKTQTLEVIRKLESEAGIADVVAFESFFLPLLKALIVTMQWTSERLTCYGNLFRTTLLMYARRFVQIEPQAGGWESDPRGCGCFYCRQLDDFLVDASTQSMGFRVCSSDRAHLHQRLNPTTISHVTDLGGTLVVTRPLPPTLAKYEQWEKRFLKAKEQIQELDQEILKPLLDVDYEFLTELRKTRRGRSREELPSARIAVRRQGPEMVDLT